jgi:hypothetical protein
MYLVIKKVNNEAIAKTADDPSAQFGSADYTIVWVKPEEVSAVILPVQYQYTSPAGVMTVDYHSGTIIPKPQIDFAIARQNQYMSMVTSGLAAVTALNGKTSATLTTNDLKTLLLFMLAMNGMLDGNGAVSVTGITADELYQKILK